MKYFLLLLMTLFSLSFSLHANAANIALDKSFDACAATGGGTMYKYNVDLAGATLKISKDGQLLVSQTFIDLHNSTGQELTEIKKGFDVYFDVEIENAIVGSKTSSKNNKSLLIGITQLGDFILVYERTEIIAFSKLCSKN